MNCFEFQSHSSDYLDGTLGPEIASDADSHASSCSSCGQRARNYRVILDTLGSQPRAVLPSAVRKAPLSANLPRLELSGSRSRWDRLPWFLRTALESVGVAGAVLLVIALVPRIRSLYEQSVQNKVDAFLTSEIAQESKMDTSLPLARGNLTGQPTDDDVEEFNGGEGADRDTAQDEADADADSDGGGDAADTAPIHVGNGQIWRFNIKTDSPHDTRPKVVQIFRELKIPESTPGLGGVEVPGGIQFDLTLPKKYVAGLKLNLEKIAVIPGEIPDPNPASPRNHPFTWYKSRSRKRIPAGLTRVVIWLSQL